VYRPFLEAAPPPIASFAPEISYYCTSLSKIIAPGLRIGFLTAPSGKADELVLGMGATSWMTPPLIAEVATQWIEDGTARRLVDWQRTELAERNRMAAEILDGFTCSALKSGLHIWLQLPDRWRAATLAQEARARDVLVTPADAFAIGWVNAPHAVRISLGGATGREALVAGLRIIVEILGRKVESSYLAI
jgi:DNA-binding transcriptional MocR family regulator